MARPGSNAERSRVGGVQGLVATSVEPLAGSLLVASISDAMTRRSSHGQASTSGPSQPSQARFEGRARLPLAWAHQTSSQAFTNMLDDALFRVAPRRKQQLPRQVQHFLSLPQAEVASAVRALQFHVIARLGLLLRAQQAIRQQLDRTSHWRPFRRLRGSHLDGEEHGRSNCSSSRASRQAQRLVEQGMIHERDLQFDEAIQCYEKATQTDPTSAECLARLSKALSDSSYIPGTSSGRAVELNRRALEVAGQAVEANPKAAYGHVACCVSRGRLALYLDNRTKVQLARLAQDDVRMALELEPNNDVAHHLLGRWNYEMAGVNAVVRTIIQMFYGTALMAGSYKEAALCFEAAVRIRPDYLIHRVELGRTYWKLGQAEAATRELTIATELDVPDINAVLQKGDAVALLAKLKGRR